MGHPISATGWENPENQRIREITKNRTMAHIHLDGEIEKIEERSKREQKTGKPAR
jgi:hypothetical protein